MKTENETTKQARIYGRFSSKPQEHGSSYSQQVDGAREYAKRNGIAIIAEPYFDKGVSGKAGKNLEKELGRYRKEAQAGEILLVHIQDRFGRQNPILLTALLYEICAQGIEIHIFGENKIINHKNLQELGVSLSTFVSSATGFQENQRKIKRINETVTETMKACSQGKLVKGALRFTPQCFKWDNVNEKVYIDEKQADIVRQIFNDYANGLGTTAIASKLNAAKVPTFYSGVTDAIWYGNSIKYILKCECYNGVLMINNEHYPILKRIVTDEVFSKVQMLMARNSTNKGNLRGRTNNIFGQIVFCKHCGGRIRGAISGKNSYHYCCKNSLLKGCIDDDGTNRPNVMLNARFVEYGFFKTFFGKGAHSLLKDNNRNLELKEQIEGCRAKLGQLDKAIANLYDLVEQGDKEAAKRIAIRKTERADTEDKIKILAAQITEDSEFDNNVATIYDMVTMQDIWINKKQLVSINGLLADNESRKKISMVLPTLFSKITFDCPKGELEAFDKAGKSLGSFTPRQFEAEIKRFTGKNTEPVTDFEPPKRTFKPRAVKTVKGTVKEYLAKLKVA